MWMQDVRSDVPDGPATSFALDVSPNDERYWIRFFSAGLACLMTLSSFFVSS
jgi:hypothetical protein